MEDEYVKLVFKYDDVVSFKNSNKVKDAYYEGLIT